jgi:hypothetical protein
MQKVWYEKNWQGSSILLDSGDYASPVEPRALLKARRAYEKVKEHLSGLRNGKDGAPYAWLGFWRAIFVLEYGP